MLSALQGDLKVGFGAGLVEGGSIMLVLWCLSGLFDKYGSSKQCIKYKFQRQ